MTWILVPITEQFFRISNCKARSGENINGNTKSNVAGNRFLTTLESQYGTIRCEVIHCSCARIQTTWFGVCLQPCCVAIVASGPASETNDCISRWRFSNFVDRRKSETSPTRKAQLSITILKKIRKKNREQGAWRIQCVLDFFFCRGSFTYSQICPVRYLPLPDEFASFLEYIFASKIGFDSPKLLQLLKETIVFRRICEANDNS